MSAAEIVGENIRRLRKARGWKQTDLAERAGYALGSSGTISKIERGLMAVDVNALQRVAEALDVDISELFVRARSAVDQIVSETLLEGWPTAVREVVERALSLAEDDQERLLRCGRALQDPDAGVRDIVRRQLQDADELIYAYRLKTGHDLAPEAENPPAG
jgi:transcriptional regulator with XRE-family HTH domain